MPILDCQLCDEHRKAIEAGCCEMNQEACVYNNCLAHGIMGHMREIMGVSFGDGVSLSDHLEKIMDRLRVAENRNS